MQRERDNGSMQPGLLPLFPLQVVLLPGAELPLHIFEDRYKEMIARGDPRSAGVRRGAGQRKRHRQHRLHRHRGSGAAPVSRTGAWIIAHARAAAFRNRTAERRACVPARRGGIFRRRRVRRRLRPRSSSARSTGIANCRRCRRVVVGITGGDGSEESSEAKPDRRRLSTTATPS